MSLQALEPPGSVQRHTAATQPTDEHSQQDISKLAYALWEQRGTPYGSADEDWIAAEQQLSSRSSRR